MVDPTVVGATEIGDGVDPLGFLVGIMVGKVEESEEGGRDA